MTKKVDPELLPFARTLLGARELTGFSQADVARALGIAQTSYSSWENGQVEPTRERVRELENVFGYPPGGLSQHLPAPYIPADSVRASMKARREHQRTEDVIRLDSDLNPRDRDVLIATYRAMRKARTRAGQSSECTTADSRLVAA